MSSRCFYFTRERRASIYACLMKSKRLMNVNQSYKKGLFDFSTSEDTCVIVKPLLSNNLHSNTELLQRRNLQFSIQSSAGTRKLLSKLLQTHDENKTA